MQEEDTPQGGNWVFWFGPRVRLDVRPSAFSGCLRRLEILKVQEAETT